MSVISEGMSGNSAGREKEGDALCAEEPGDLCAATRIIHAKSPTLTMQIKAGFPAIDQ